MATQDVIVLNDFGAMRVEERQRTTSAGTSSRYTVTITAEPIVHDFATVKLSRTVPEAIATLLKEQIRNIEQRVGEATILKRKYAAAAVARGAAWATRRYSGGRIGALAPKAASNDRMFNDSGRFAEGVAVMQNVEERSFTINVAANRLRPESFPGGTFQRMIERLRELAPAWRGGIEVLQDATVKAAVELAQAEWIVNTARAGAAKGSANAQILAKYAWKYGVKPLLIG